MQNPLEVNSSSDDIPTAAALKLFETHFLNRTDALAFAPPWNGAVARAVVTNNLAELLTAHVSGACVRVPWQNQQGQSGETQPMLVRIGTYAPSPEGTTVFGCVDFDGGGRHKNPLDDPLGAALAFVENCTAAGLPCHLEKSGGGQGWHVWIFFDQPQSAAVVRKRLLRLLPAAKLADGRQADATKGLGIELFPKQDRIPEGGYGNMVWLPLWHGAKGGGNLFYKLDDGGELVPYQPEAFATVTETLRDPDEGVRTEGKPFQVRVPPNYNGRPTIEHLVQKYIRHPGEGRNENGFDLACQLRDNGYSIAEAEAGMRAYQKAVEKGGHLYTLGEALKSLRSAYNGEKRDPWRRANGAKFRAGLNDGQSTRPGGDSLGTASCGFPSGKIDSPDSPDSHDPSEENWGEWVPLGALPAAEPFPAIVLPTRLREYVEEIARAVNVPLDFVGVPLLTMAGAAIGNSRRLAITDSHTQGAIVFSAVINRPGNGKSPAREILQKPFDAAQGRMVDAWKRELADWKKAPPDDRPPRPTCGRCLVDDTTTESLKATLSENPRGLLMSQDELVALVASMGQYKQGRGNDRQFYLKLWSGATITNDRRSDKDKDGGPTFIRRPFLGITGCLTVADVAAFRDGNRDKNAAGDDGWFDRFLVTLPEDLPAVGEQWNSVSRESELYWQGVVDGLLSLKMVPGDDGHPRAELVQLTANARHEWKSFTDNHAAELNDPDFPDCLRGPWSKLRAYCARLALIVHHLRWACHETQSKDVDGPSLQAAVRLVDYFKAHARRVRLVGGGDRLVEDAKRVWGWVVRKKREEFKAWEVHKDIQSDTRFPSVESLQAPLGLLERRNYLRVRPPAERKGPGDKSAPVYIVNPAALENT
jgi:hypothetical protein